MRHSAPRLLGTLLLAITAGACTDLSRPTAVEIDPSDTTASIPHQSDKSAMGVVMPMNEICEWDWGSESCGYEPVDPPEQPIDNAHDCNISHDVCEGEAGGGGGYNPPPGHPGEEEPWEVLCNPDYDLECKHRYRLDMTSGEIAALRGIPNALRQNGCSEQADVFELALQENRVALWDKRITRMGEPLLGRSKKDLGLIFIWTGYNREPGDNVNWIRTAAHEAAHIKYPQYTESRVQGIANACV